jgi:hypothetical protein
VIGDKPIAEHLKARRADLLSRFEASGQAAIEDPLSGFLGLLFERKGAIGSCVWEYLYLRQHADAARIVQGKEASLPAIAHAVGKSTPAVRKSLKQLRSAGALSWERKDGRPNRYRLLM